MMDPDRRRMLVFAAAGAAMGGLPSATTAGEEATSIVLEAQDTGGMATSPGATAPLAYGKSPGAPVRRVAKDSLVHIRLKNGMAEPTALDWRGLRAGNSFEVVPGLVGTSLTPGAETTIEMRPSDSGTLWFHPPFVPGWSDQTGRGLAGVLIVGEPSPPMVDDDIVLFLSDRLESSGLNPANRLAVNGKATPETQSVAPGSRLRLRLVNGSTRQAIALGFEGARPMVIAIDSQPSDLFRPLDDTLPVGPGARFDVLIDVPRMAGQEVRIVLRGADTAAPATILFVAGADGALRPAYPPIAALPPNPALPPAIALERATRAEIAVRKNAMAPPGAAAFVINGTASLALSKKPLFTARQNTAVVLGFANQTAELTGFRLHGQTMRQLHALDDGWDPYWRDSILVPPGKTVHAAFLADRPGRWLIESPFFEQATHGLRHWFEIM